MSGRKIIDGLKDAVAGNFSRVTIDGQVWIRQPEAAGEPVAWRWRYKKRNSNEFSQWICFALDMLDGFKVVQRYNLDEGFVQLEPLYASPPPSDRAKVVEALAIDFENSVHHVWDNYEVADRIRALSAHEGKCP